MVKKAGRNGRDSWCRICSSSFYRRDLLMLFSHENASATNEEGLLCLFGV